MRIAATQKSQIAWMKTKTKTKNKNRRLRDMVREASALRISRRPWMVLKQMASADGGKTIPEVKEGPGQNERIELTR